MWTGLVCIGMLNKGRPERGKFQFDIFILS